MAYYSGYVAAVPTANREAYVEHARKSWPHFRKRGAIRSVETWGEDVPHGKQTDFYRATQAKDDESVVFAWIEWPDRETADAAWADIMADESMAADMGEMPFDGRRMFWGSFAPVIAEGTDRGAGWYQGFLTPVPKGNKAAFTTMATEAWNEMFRPNGCIGSFESWGEDVPRGQVTDMYRAVEAQDDEVVVMSWAAWPDRATCDAAAAKMEADMEGKEMPEMPFDGRRMIWGGFAPIFESDRG